MKFHKIRVEDIVKTTDDCSIVSFHIPNDLRSNFQYSHGQYLTLKAKIGSEEVRRSYSLCSSPMENKWQIGVKKIDGGVFSSYVNDVLKSGDELEIAAPQGRFTVPCLPTATKNYVAFAAGSGITPIMSIIKTHLDQEPKSSFRLFYTNQTVASIILKEELEALKNIYLDRLEIFYFLTKEHRNFEFFNGRLDGEKLKTIFTTICNPLEIDDFFVCGPEEMIFKVRDFLIDKQIDSKKIHFELFTSSVSQIPDIKKAVGKKFEGKTSKVVIQEGGKRLNFEMAQGTGNLLDAALNNSADLPFACKGGVCCTCRAKLVEGEVNMKVNYGLEEDEIEDGYILTCQSLPISDKVVINFDS